MKNMQTASRARLKL